MFLIGSGWSTLSFLLISRWLLFSVTLQTIITPSALPLGCCLQHFCHILLSFSTFRWFSSELESVNPVGTSCYHFFFSVCQHVTNICFPSLFPWHLPPSPAHSRVTDQNPLLSANRLHLPWTVWKDHLHVCDEEVIDIFVSGILCRRQSPEKPLSPLSSRPSVFLLLLLCQSDTSSGIFNSGQSSCHLKCTQSRMFIGK